MLKLKNNYKILQHNVSTMVLYSQGREFKSSGDNFIFFKSKKFVFQEPVGIYVFKTLNVVLKFNSSPKTTKLVKITPKTTKTLSLSRSLVIKKLKISRTFALELPRGIRHKLMLSITFFD
jgi:hypothetical protein